MGPQHQLTFRSRANVSKECRMPDTIGETTKMVKYKDFNVPHLAQDGKDVDTGPLCKIRPTSTHDDES